MFSFTKKEAVLASALLLSSAGASASCDHDHGAHPDTPGHPSANADDHAPLGVMGEHMHHAGGWMLSYRLMAMDITWSAPCMLTLTAGWQYAF